MHALDLPYPQFCRVFSPRLHTNTLVAILYMFMTQTTHTIELAIVTALGLQQLVQTGNRLHCRKWEHYKLRGLFS